MAKKIKVSKDVLKEPALIIYDQIMLTPGVWNGVKFTSDQIKLGISNTDWTNPENYALIDYHPKDKVIPSATSWQGYFDSISYKTLEDGVQKEGMYGDLYIYDPVLASKLLSRKSPLAVSIDASYARSNYGATSLKFTNTALVYRPGCKDAYIQLEDHGEDSSIRIVCEEDVQVVEENFIDDQSSKGTEGEVLSNQRIKMEYELCNDQLVKVYNKSNSSSGQVFEGSVLSINKDESGKVILSVINSLNEIAEFEVGEFLFLPVMDIPEQVVESIEQLNKEEIVKEKESLKLEEKNINKEDIQLNINTDERRLEIEKFNKMDSNNIESFDARLSLLEKTIKEKLGITLESEQPKEEKSEEVTPKEEVKEEVKEVKEEVVESKEEIKEEVVTEPVTEEVKIESTEVQKTEEIKSEEVVEAKVEETPTVVQLQATESENSDVSEIKTEIVEKEEVKEETKPKVKEESKIAVSKTAVQLEGTEKLTKEKQVSKFDAAYARLNNKSHN